MAAAPAPASAPPPRWRRWRRPAAIALAVLALLALVAWLAVPPTLRWSIETVAARELGRPTRLAQASFNPFTLTATLRGLQIDGTPQDAAPLLKVEELRANVSAMSVLRLAPVIEGLRIDGFTIDVVRLEPARFNFSDIVERLRSKPAPPDADAEPAQFAVYNIALARGLVRLDDRVVGARHELADIALGIPFVSTLPVHAEIDVQPGFSARLNGTPLALKASTKPFTDTLESAVDLKLDGLDVPSFLGYSPVPLNFAVPHGKLDADLRLAFRRAAPAQQGRPAQAADFVISGSVAVREFLLQAPRTTPQSLLGWQRLGIDIDSLAPLAARTTLRRVQLTAPEAWVTRDARGTLNWQAFAAAPLAPRAASTAAPTGAPAASAATAPGAAAPGTAAPAAAGATGSAPAIAVQQVEVSGGVVHVRDDGLGGYATDLTDVAVNATGLSTTAAEPAQLRVALRGTGLQAASVDGTLRLQPLAGEFAFDVSGIDLRALAKPVGVFLDGSVAGTATTRGRLSVARADNAVAVNVTELAAGVDRFTLRGPQGAALDVAELRLAGGALDLAARSIAVARIDVVAPRVQALREADGSIGWTRLVRQRAADSGASAAAAPAGAAPAPWKVRIAEFDLTRGDIGAEDRGVAPPYVLRAQAVALNVKDIVADGSAPARLALRARLGRNGTLAANGDVRWDQPRARLNVDVRNLDVANVRSYFADRLNAVLASAEVSARGRVDVAVPAQGPLQASYDGNVRLANLHALNPDGAGDLLRWQALDIDRVALRLSDAPPRVELGQVKLADFFARVVVSEQGRLNLADIVKRDAAAPAGDKSAAPATAERTAAAPSAKNAGATAATPSGLPAPDAARPTIRIAGVALERGNVNFTDNFIKPNYTANLTGIGGSVTTLASDSAQPATLELAGKVDDDAPVEIKGTLNPLAPTLQLDVGAATRGVDMPRFSPYTARYAGYPIVKGKLSMDVRYKLDNNKLEASNRLFLDQLTFGDKVDSPDATKLPVLLAVSLLKNTRGEIDINLPISGSLDDPKFSLGGIIVQVIVNLLAKAITAPFSLLAAAFGGGDELGYVEFAPGAAALAPEQVKRIDTLAKALNDRPGVRVDIVGRVDPAVDADGVRRAKYEAKLRAAKVRRLVRAGGESVDPAKVTIEAAERPALIAAVYDEEKIPDKPRNVIGIARTIPAPEMEALILKHLQAAPEDLRALANERAAAVRNHLEAAGKVPRERLFLVEPKLTADGIQDKGAKTRVDFVLK